MGLRGPAKNPGYLQLIKGNPGRRPIAEPEAAGLNVPKVFSLPAPSHFDEAHCKVWDKVTSVIGLAGGLAEADQFSLQRYVVFFVLFEQTRANLQKIMNKPGHETGAFWAMLTPEKEVETEELDAEGKKKKKTVKGTLRSYRPFPQVKVMMDLSNNLMRLEREFGLTPSARASWGNPAGGGGDEGDDILD